MMKAFAYTSALLAMLAIAGMSQAQTTTTEPSNEAIGTTNANCPAPGSVPDSEIPENCKTAAQTTPDAGATDPNAAPLEQNATGTTPEQPAASTAETKTSPPVDINPADAFLASNFIGQTVYTAANENVGEINDLIVEKTNGMVVAIVGVGGFLGMGEKDVAVALDKITAVKQEGDALRLTISASRAELEAAPAFDRTRLTMNTTQ